MADPTNPPTLPDPNNIEEIGTVAQQSAEQLGNLSDVAIQSQDSFNKLNNVVGESGSMFSSLSNMIEGVGISLNTTKAFTDNQVTQFALLSNAVLGARESYKSLAGTDFSGFRNQIDDLMKISLESPLSPAAAAARNALEGVASSIGGKTADEISKMSVKSLGLLATSLLTSADNALKLQTGVISLAAKTGELGSVFDLGGQKLENINILLEKHAAMISGSIAATGAAPESVEKYYMALGSVPGALSAIVASSGDADDSVTMLTAAMKVASGSGRDFTDVVDDLKIAFRNYGMTGESALRFSAQIGDVTQKLGVELDIVKNALRSGSEAFKMFAHTGTGASQMASGLADIMSHYGTALESTGLQGTQAVDVIGNMTQQMGKMSIAQKSFLSQQTGGTGGLMGAFQIDKMLRDGDIKGVFEKVRMQMQKQFGQIVSVDEAAQSESAANQMTRQMTMLKQGPLGQFARSDQEAQSILEGFKAAQEGRGGGGINPDVLKDTMDKGTSVQEKSYSVMTDMRSHLEAIRRSSDVGTLSFLQKTGLTAGTGSGLKPGEMLQSEGANKSSEALRRNMTGATNMEAEQFQGSLADVTKNKKLIDTTGKNAVAALTGLTDSFRILPLSIKGITDSLQQAISSGDVEGTKSHIQRLEDNIKKLKATTDDTTVLEQIGKQEEALSKAKEYWAVASTQTLGSDVMAPGAVLGAAANRSSGTATFAPRGAAGGTGEVTNAPGVQKQDVTVHVTGFCIKCKQEMESGHQANGIAPQAH